MFTVTEIDYSMQIAVAQINYKVADLRGNISKILQALAWAESAGADLLLTSELSLTGYPLDDLVWREGFRKTVGAALEEITGHVRGKTALLVGAPLYASDAIYNGAHVIHSGRIQATARKINLPNYGVFDEKRTFTPGQEPLVLEWAGLRLGITICEDIWDAQCDHYYDVASTLAANGADLTVNMSASPFILGKQATRLEVGRQFVQKARCPLIYVNQMGGQDDLVFDGASFALDTNGNCVYQAPAWEPASFSLQAKRSLVGVQIASSNASVTVLENFEASLYGALVCGTRDYIEKNGFPGALLGVSGGIDSALVAAIAADAIGPQRIHCVSLPSPYTADQSNSDAQELCAKLGTRYSQLPISDLFKAANQVLQPLLKTFPSDVTPENLQARLRGLLLMALSNNSGYLLLSTGNKSEIAVGYCTLYGDMCGGYNPIKDVTKTQVYALAAYRNGHRPKGCLGPQGKVIPVSIIQRPPTAELRPGQLDQDSLPPYPVLDTLLYDLERDPQKLLATATAGVDVKDLYRRIEDAEYKRAQACPGPQVSDAAFSPRNRRIPLTHGRMM